MGGVEEGGNDSILIFAEIGAYRGESEMLNTCYMAAVVVVVVVSAPKRRNM